MKTCFILKLRTKRSCAPFYISRKANWYSYGVSDSDMLLIASQLS